MKAFKLWLEGNPLPGNDETFLDDPAGQPKPSPAAANPAPVLPNDDETFLDDPAPSGGQPEDVSVDVPAFDPGKKGVKPAGEGDNDEGTMLGNLGAKIVGTLEDWVKPEGGFLTRVKNKDLLEKGIGELSGLIRTFNQFANRFIARSAVETRDLKTIQSPWFFTMGLRLQALMEKGKDEEGRNLLQLQLLAPKLSDKWNKFIGHNGLGVRVTNPEVLAEPGGSLAVEEPSVGVPNPVPGLQ